MLMRLHTYYRTNVVNILKTSNTTARSAAKIAERHIVPEIFNGGNAS